MSPLFAVFDIASGALISVGSVVADPLPAGMAALDISAVDMAVSEWDAATRTMVPRGPLVLTEMSRGEWMARLGDAREDMLNELRIDPAVPIPIRGKIERLYKVMDRRTGVDVSFAETIAGVNALAALMVWAKSAMGRTEGLDVADVPAFVAMMLAPKVVPVV